MSIEMLLKVVYIISMDDQNTTKLPKGVYYDPKRRIKKFKASIRVKGKLKALGYWRTAEEAYKAFMEAKALNK